MILVEKPIGGVWFFWLLDWLVASKFTWGVLSRKEDSIQREKCHYWTTHQELHVWMMSLAPSVAISHKTLSSVLSDSIWQCFLVKSRVFLFCCLGMFIPHLQKSHPLNTWKLRHPSSSQLWAAPKTKKRNIWHACNAQKKMSIYTSSWERFKKWWELEPPPFVVQWLHCSVLVPIRQPHLKASCVPAKPSPYAIMWLLCT